MKTIIRIYFNMLSCGILLLSSLLIVSPAQAQFGINGFEFSPVRILTTNDSEGYRTLSGTVIFSLPNPTTEIAVPFLWGKNEDGLLFDNYRAVTADIQWRKYDSAQRNGGYVGVLMRVFNGKSEDPLLDEDTETDIGVGVVAGFRRTISGGFYYGANMSLTAFPDEISNVNFGEHDFFRNQLSFTLDFLKIGYRFY